MARSSLSDSRPWIYDHQRRTLFWRIRGSYSAFRNRKLSPTLRGHWENSWGFQWWQHERRSRIHQFPCIWKWGKRHWRYGAGAKFQPTGPHNGSFPSSRTTQIHGRHPTRSKWERQQLQREIPTKHASSTVILFHSTWEYNITRSSINRWELLEKTNWKIKMEAEKLISSEFEILISDSRPKNSKAGQTICVK